MPNRLKGLAVQLLRHRALGIPASLAAARVGAADLSRKIARECRYLPEIVRFKVPGVGPLKIHSAGGTDQVAFAVQWQGWDHYERPLPRLWVECCRETRTVCDIGAYTGFFAILAAASGTRHVVAFEPNPEPLEWLRRNLALNGLGDRIQVVPAAVSDQPGQHNLYVPTTSTGWLESASSLSESFRDEHLQVFPVPVVTLDDSVPGPIDALKIDVESYESRVLWGPRRILKDDRPLVFLEVLRRTDPGPLEAIREANDYVTGVLLPDGIEWRDRVEMVMGRLDHVWCPRERRGWFDDLLERLGLRSDDRRGHRGG